MKERPEALGAELQGDDVGVRWASVRVGPHNWATAFGDCTEMNPLLYSGTVAGAGGWSKALSVCLSCFMVELHAERWVSCTGTSTKER